MALETLKGIKKIGSEEIVVMDDLRETNPEFFRPDGSMHYHLFEEKIRPFKHIYIRHDVGSISFTIQNGPIKEVGKNGCQVTDMIAVAKHIIEELNKKFPCRENAMTITKLDEALMWQVRRTLDREAREVEGTSKG
jgi:hypothetical protein